MQKDEWNKCFIWLSSLFPKWTTSQATSVVWFSEIGEEMTITEFQNAVRACMAESPSAFPPGVFEIKAKLTPKFEQPDILWAEILELAKGSSRCLTDFSQPARLAIRAIGGISHVGRVNIEELPWLKKDFLRAFNDFSERALNNAAKNIYDEIESPEIKKLSGSILKRLQ